MKKEFFGKTPSGETVSLYTLNNGLCSLKLIDRGAAIVSFSVFGRDVIGGFDTLEDYLNDDSHQGATIGRVANRIGGASFTMDGKEYRLPDNDMGNCLHGGDGFDHRMWTVTEHKEDGITFEYTSPNGEEGFPAELKVAVSFTIEGTTLVIDYKAVPNGKTPIALTNHSYFNLDGFGKDIKKHKVLIYADKYTETDANLIPTGTRPYVKGTVFDFTEPHEIGERIGGDFIGYDHNFVLNFNSFGEFSGKTPGLAAEVWSDDVKMKVYTDQPGIQFYIGNFLGAGPDFKGGIKQIRHGAFCLEAQTEPNCINHGEGFYDKGEIYTQTTVYSFEKL